MTSGVAPQPVARSATRKMRVQSLIVRVQDSANVSKDADSFYHGSAPAPARSIPVIGAVNGR